MTETTKLAIVGLSAGYSWAGNSHLPAIKSIGSDKYKVVGLVNTSIESSKASREKYGLAGAEVYDSIKSLVSQEDPEKSADTVLVSVKVPHHYEVSKAIIEGGKDIIVEWPLGNGLKEAEELNKLAKSKGVKTGVVLQARKAPAIVSAKKLVESGAIGKIISTNLTGRIVLNGQYLEEGTPFEYSNDVTNGANILTIANGHNLDALAYVLGEFDSLSAIVKTQFPEVDVIKTSENKQIKINKQKPKNSPDQVLVQGLLKSGAAASCHLRAGQLSDLTAQELLRWEIHGSKGDIFITSEGAYLEMFKLSIKLSQLDENGNRTGIQDLTPNGVDPIVDNVKFFHEEYLKQEKGQYVPPQLSNAEGYPTFEDALIRHRQIEAILRSSESGKRETY